MSETTRICHVWYEEDRKVMYFGNIEKAMCKCTKCVVAYWGQDEICDEDGTDYDMSTRALAADLICDDLIM